MDLGDSRTGRVANHRRAYVHLIDGLPRLIGFGEPVSNSFFPVRYDILVPYLVLFFGSILLMGLPMFRMNRQLWLVTVATTVLLLGSMVFVMYMGVG